MRTLSFAATLIGAVLATGCVSTAEQADKPAALSSAAANPHTLFSARLQAAEAVVTTQAAQGLTKVTFPGITAFSHDGARLSEALQRQLSAVADTLKTINYQQLTVVGHTDSSGLLAYNQKLSQQRAEQVAQFLVQQGLPAEQLAAQGRGPAEPIADNSNAAGRAANRRVELELLF